MSKDPHCAALEKMYLAAPINTLFQPTIDVAEGQATITMEVSERLFHSAGALHGSVYFKMLDDAAFFAANSLEREMFVLTVSFTIQFLRPLRTGTVRSVGRVVGRGASEYTAEAVLYDTDDTQVARVSGVFVRSRIPLREASGYAG